MGGIAKSALNVATMGMSNAFESNRAQKKALQAQKDAMEEAQRTQQEAQQRALAMQEKAQTQADQANEKAQKATANLSRESADKGNSADLTSGLAMKPNTRGATLGNGQSLGTSEDEEDWF
jgi:FKBP-type peptidyl-prolyl cis-trans isomerase